MITGGEPLVDHAPMAELVNGLTAMPAVECIRIDTRILQEYLPGFRLWLPDGLAFAVAASVLLPGGGVPDEPLGAAARGLSPDTCGQLLRRRVAPAVPRPCALPSNNLRLPG